MSGPEYRVRVYRVTFDTNIFFHALIRRRNTANHLMALWLDDQFLLVLSQPIVDEVERVVSRPHLIRKYRYTPEAIANLMDLLTHRAVIVEAPFSHQLCRDTDDNHVVDCAIWGRVQFLVSYDKDLSDDSDLRRALFEFGIAVSTPEVFAERLEEELVV